ncbi:MAG: transporter substrate-binding domain-containing protein [Pseudomonadota bacterium]
MALAIRLALLVGLALAFPAVAEPLQVGTVERQPFSMKRGTGYIGYSIELWDEVARDARLKYDVREFATFSEMLEALAAGHIDAAVANITMTADREAMFDFSYPIFDSGLQILVRRERASDKSIFEVFLSGGLYWLIAVALGVLVVAAHAIWLIERGQPGFDQRYWPGVWDGFWWAAVTVTSVGYGDQTPSRDLSKVIAMMWMVFSVFLLSLFVAKSTEVFVTENLAGPISSLDDLQHRTVGTIGGSTAEDFLSGRPLRLRTFDSPAELYDALGRAQLDAVVFDAPILQYFALTDGAGRFRTVGDVFNPERFGFALASDSPYFERINRSLLRAREAGSVERLRSHWFGKQ